MALQPVLQASSSRSFLKKICSLHPTCLLITSSRTFSSTRVCNRTFYEPHKTPLRYQREEKPLLYHLKRGSKLFWPELKKLWHETKENLRSDPEEVMPGDYKLYWTFNNETDVKKWKTTADSDHAEGYSTCSFVCNKNGNAVFNGILNNKPPKDGIIERAGYCNLRLPSFTKSFKRPDFLDWTDYTHLIMRVRGDGRMYSLTIYTEGKYDVEWHDAYFYPLYTRGGPHWQNVKIPLSKFVFASKGTIQDEQNDMLFNCISSFGLTISDRIDGPFSLEIESIGVYCDPSDEPCDGEQTSHYDMYTVPRSAPG